MVSRRLQCDVSIPAKAKQAAHFFYRIAPLVQGWNPVLMGRWFAKQRPAREVVWTAFPDMLDYLVPTRKFDCQNTARLQDPSPFSENVLYFRDEKMFDHMDRVYLVCQIIAKWQNPYVAINIRTGQVAINKAVPFLSATAKVQLHNLTSAITSPQCLPFW